MTSLDLEATFPDDNACKAYLAGRRWQDKVPALGVAMTRCMPSLVSIGSVKPVIRRAIVSRF